MNIPLSVDSKDLSSFTFTITIIYILVVVLNFGKIMSDIVLNGWQWDSTILLLIFLFALILGFVYLARLIPILLKKELLTNKYHEERTVNEVIDQDYKLLQMKVMEEQHNLEVRKWNKENPENKIHSNFKWRTIKSIARQAFDVGFYEKTYGYRILNKKKKTKRDR